MYNYPDDRFHDPANEQSQDDRRPRRLVEIVGQENIVARLQLALRNGGLPQKRAFIGPTGGGKTTLGITSARAELCPSARKLGDVCGECRICRLRNLSSLQIYEEWTGAELEQDWKWWNLNGKALLDRPGWVLFLDEAQDLSKLHQKALFRQLEKARATVILATTHRHEIVDALLNRFGTNVFEVRRPTVEQAVDLMQRHCGKLDVHAERPQLTRVAKYYVVDLRQCVDFVYTARDQAPDRVVTDEFVNLVLDIDPDDNGLGPQSGGPVEL